jgi:hypothetical protein
MRTKMKKLLTFFLAIALISGILSQVTIAGYNGGYGSISGSAGGGPATSMTIGTTTVSGGTNGNCLTISAGALGNQACAAGANTTLSNLGSTAINASLDPASSDSISLGTSHYWNNILGDLFQIHNAGDGGTTSITRASGGGATNLVLPFGNGSSGQALSTDGSGNLSWSTFSTFNSSVPTPIGATTPNTGAFTTLTVNSCSGCAGGSTSYGNSIIQTVISGPVDSNGAANFLPATTTGLNFTTQNITGSIPLVVTSVNGYNSSGRVSTIGIQSSNFTFTSLPNSTTSYLFVTVTGGALTTGSTTTAPVYQYTGSAAVANGQYTYVITDSKMYLGNGSTAPQVNVVFVGEAVASGGNITSSVNYAYNGYFRSAQTTFPAAGGLTTFSHNIGVQEVEAWSILINTTAEAGYSVGDFAFPQSYNGSGFPHYNGIALTSRNALQRYRDSSTDIVVSRSSPGSVVNITAANWKIIVYAKRRF